MQIESSVNNTELEMATITCEQIMLEWLCEILEWYFLSEFTIDNIEK